MVEIIDLNYIPAGKLRQLNEYVAKYTYFATLKELLSKENNYRAILYNEPLDSNSAKREINEIAEVYDDYMKRNNDPRRLYRV